MMASLDVSAMPHAGDGPLARAGDRRRHAGRFGYMPEERGLYPKMRVRDQLAYFARLHGLGAAAADAAADAWSARLGLEGSAPATGWRRCRSGTSNACSSASALVHDPEVLVLDEPFSGLDPVGVDVLSGVLQERAAGGVPVVFSRAPARAGRAAVRGRRDHQPRPHRGHRAGWTDLRDRGRRGEQRPACAFEGDGDGRWLTGIPGAELVEAGPRGVLVRLANGGDPERVLDAARAAGTVNASSRSSGQR